MVVFLSALIASLFLAACSGGSNATSPTLAPAFASTPGTAASEGATYAYQIVTSPASEPVTLTLVTAPSGATLSGNTLTWTPTAPQSRIANQFSVTATGAGGSATQSWSISPSGTVTGTWVDTYWTSGIPVSVPMDFSKVPLPPRALVRQPDGSFQIVPRSGNSDGTFSIPNIPAGYYWLEPAANAYWTSSSTFDFGADLPGPAPSGTTNAPFTGTTTTIALSLSGLEPSAAGSEVAFLWDSSPIFSLLLPAPAGGATLTTSTGVNSNINLSQSAAAFLAQYEPQTVGALNLVVLGPNATQPSLTMSSGTTNTITQRLARSNASSFDVNIKGSAWVPLFSNAGPNTVTPQRADLELATQPFVTGTNVPFIFAPSVPLFGDLQAIPATLSPVCTNSHAIDPHSFTVPPGEPAITTDQDFGSAQYDDPFPSGLQRVFTFCQSASVPIPIPGSTTPVAFLLVDTQSSAVPTSPISPLIGQVQNPTINGMSLFVAGGVSATGVTLSWTAPNGTAPTGYRISTLMEQTLPLGGLGYVPGLSFYTAKTSALLPPLQPGATYVFLITSILDGAANFESRPNRSALPIASVSVVSAPITMQ